MMQPEVPKNLPRVFDVAAASLLLLITTPILCAVAFLIAWTSHGGVFFKQERVGQNGGLFTLYKFRTMKIDNAGPEITRSNDTRITALGRFLRATKLDELPTFWNVLKGEMALVGPRPEVPRYVNLEDPLWRTVLRVRPGITDPMTIRLRHEERLLRQIEGDVERYYCEELLPMKLSGYVDYLERRSWQTDLLVLWQTVLAVFSPGVHSVAARWSTGQNGER